MRGPGGAQEATRRSNSDNAGDGRDEESKGVTVEGPLVAMNRVGADRPGWTLMQ